MQTMLAAAVAVLMSACSQAGSSQPVAGSDRDDHGCVASAGYRWCAKTAQCERPWELAREKRFQNTAEAFDAYCGG